MYKNRRIFKYNLSGKMFIIIYKLFDIIKINNKLILINSTEMRILGMYTTHKGEGYVCLSP